MNRKISVGELRQNPTPMLREVKRGAKYTVTDHGEPIAEIVSHRTSRWVPAQDLARLLSELGGDQEWASEVAEAREAEPADDSWTGLK